MYGLFEDEDDVFVGSPKSKFLDVVFNANNDVVRYELEKFIDKVAAMEVLLTQHIGDDIDKQLKSIAITNEDEVDTKAKSLYIELMGAVLSKSE
ncbi:DUF2018 family protein [bacterium]|nr:DUF2018 family protein [bacterium]MBU1993738.1 DUF2018 family protein [bacterium]